jgi:hypothetical protein
MVDSGGAWDQPAQYTTIQLVDLDADGRAELVGRSQSGLEVWSWDGAASQWSQWPLDAVLTEGLWSNPQYYATIQFANVSDFNDSLLAGRPELLARGPDGVEIYLLTTDRQFFQASVATRYSDANGWDDPTNYETIQTADVDGDGFAELVARRDADIGVDRLVADGTWLELDSGSLLLDDDPWAQGAEYYATIQAGNIDGVPGDELIARGPYGLRTWRFDAADGWRRYRDYGFAYGAGGAIDASSDVYTAMNSYLDLPEPANDIRSRYDDTDLATLPTELVVFQDCLVDSLSSPDTPTLTCARIGAVEPFDNLAVSKNDWDAMANQLISEIGSATQAANLFDDHLTVADELFENQNSEFPALSTDIELEDFDDTATGFDQISLWEEITSAVGSALPFIPAASEASTAFNTISSVLGVIDVFDTTSPGQSKFEQTYDEMADQIAVYQQQIQDAIVGNHTYVGGDYGLLTAVARQQVLAPLDSDAYLSGGRYAFTQWIYQSYLPLKNWALWENTGCQDISQVNPTEIYVICDIAGATDDPLPGNIQSVDVYDLVDGDGDAAPLTFFTGILRPDEVNVDEPCIGDPKAFAEPQQCTWKSIDADDVSTLWDPITTECTYDPSGPPGDAWHYGCTLGEGDAIFENENGWSWKTLSVTISEDTDGSVRKNPVDTTTMLSSSLRQRRWQPWPHRKWPHRKWRHPWRRGDMLDFSIEQSEYGAGVALIDLVDLGRDDARVLIERVLDEQGGHDELAERPEVHRNVPIVLERKHFFESRFLTRAAFATPRDQVPDFRVVVTTRERRDGLRKTDVHLVGRQLDIRDPRACAESEEDGVAELDTRLVFDDRVSQPVRVSRLNRWACLADGRGEVRALRLLDEEEEPRAGRKHGEKRGAKQFRRPW